MVAAVRIPHTIKSADEADAAYSSLSPDENARFWQLVDAGKSSLHAINVIRSQRAQDAARGMDIGAGGKLSEGTATPLQTAAVTAGNAATFGGIPTIAAALGQGEGDTFADRKKSNVADVSSMTAQNPLAASAGDVAGLIAPALAGGLAARGAAGSPAGARLLTLAKEGAKAGAPLGALGGALQTDTGTAGDVAWNAAKGGAFGAATGAAGAVVPAAAVRIAPTLASTTVSQAARAPLQTALGLENDLETAAATGSSRLAHMMARAAPAVGKVAGGAVGANVGGVVPIFGHFHGGKFGAQLGGKAGARVAQALEDIALQPYSGASMPVRDFATSPGDVTREIDALKARSSPIPEVTRTIVDPGAATRAATPATPTNAGGNAMDITPGRDIQLSNIMSPADLREQLTAMNQGRIAERAAAQRATAAMPTTRADTPRPRFASTPASSSPRQDMPLDAMVGDGPARPLEDVAGDIYAGPPEEAAAAARDDGIQQAIEQTRGARRRAPPLDPQLALDVSDGDVAPAQAGAMQRSMEARAAAPKSGASMKEIVRQALVKDPRMAQKPAALARALGLSVADVRREVTNLQWGR